MTLTAGNYYVYAEYPGANLDPGPAADVGTIEVTDADHQILPVSGSDITETYSFGSHEGRLIGRFTAAQDGSYTLTTPDADPSPTQTIDLAVSKGSAVLSSRVLAAVFGALGLGALSAPVGVILVVVTLVRRSRWRHAHLPPPGPTGIPPGQAPYGQAPYGQGPYGQAPPGQGPYGHRPRVRVPMARRRTVRVARPGALRQPAAAVRARLGHRSVRRALAGTLATLGAARSTRPCTPRSPRRGRGDAGLGRARRPRIGRGHARRGRPDHADHAHPVHHADHAHHATGLGSATRPPSAPPFSPPVAPAVSPAVSPPRSHRPSPPRPPPPRPHRTPRRLRTRRRDPSGGDHQP